MLLLRSLTIAPLKIFCCFPGYFYDFLFVSGVLKFPFDIPRMRVFKFILLGICWCSWNCRLVPFISSEILPAIISSNMTSDLCLLYPHSVTLIKTIIGTSLVAQWLRIRLPVQGTWVRALVQEDSTCRGATKPMCHNY